MRRCAVVLALSCCLGIVSLARGNSGTQLPLSQYQAGTEVTTLVPNGNFETLSGTDPTVWTKTLSSMQVGSPINPASPSSVTGSMAAHGIGTTNNGSGGEGQYSQTISGLDPSLHYVLSAYLWNFGTPGPAPSNDNSGGDLSMVELTSTAPTAGTKVTLTLEPFSINDVNQTGTPDGDKGYFVYMDFTGISAGTLDARLDENFSYAGGVIAQMDNVAITPASQFAPPQPIPEPAALSVLGLGAVALLARRRRN